MADTWHCGFFYAAIRVLGLLEAAQSILEMQAKIGPDVPELATTSGHEFESDRFFPI